MVTKPIRKLRPLKAADLRTPVAVLREAYVTLHGHLATEADDPGAFWAAQFQRDLSACTAAEGALVASGWTEMDVEKLYAQVQGEVRAKGRDPLTGAKLDTPW